jgi:hypothetical protein
MSEAAGGASPADDRPRDSWLVLLVFTPPFWMFVGGVETVVRGSAWLGLSRLGLSCVVLAGTLLALPLFGESGGALVRWDAALQKLQLRVFNRVSKSALRVLRWASGLAALIALVVVSALIEHWSGPFASRGFDLALLWAFALLVVVSILASLIWIASKMRRSEGILFRDLFEVGFTQPRRDAVIALAIAIFLLGSVLQYVALGHGS